MRRLEFLSKKEEYIFVTHLDPRGQVYNKKNKGGKR